MMEIGHKIKIIIGPLRKTFWKNKKTVIWHDFILILIDLSSNQVEASHLLSWHSNIQSTRIFSKISQLIAQSQIQFFVFSQQSLKEENLIPLKVANPIVTYKLYMKCLYPLICVYNSENRSEMNQQILELRYYDCAKQMTVPDGPAVLSSAACDGLINLLEVIAFESFLIPSFSLKQGADMANTPNYVKFYCRTFFLGLIRNLGDAITEDMMSSSIKSSLYSAYEICSNPEQFDAFLFNDANSELLPYYLSAQHQQIQAHISELIGLNFVMSTPYEFAAVVSSHLPIPNLERIIGYIIDFALTIPATLQLTSEEIFVGSCLVLWQQHNLEGLGQLLMNYFQPSLQMGSLLKTVINEELLQSLNDEA